MIMDDIKTIDEVASDAGASGAIIQELLLAELQKGGISRQDILEGRLQEMSLDAFAQTVDASNRAFNNLLSGTGSAMTLQKAKHS